MKSSQPSHPSVSETRASIRAAGLRGTMPRIAVLSYLQSMTTPLSHAEIFDALEEQGFDRATIYRNLVDLTEVGLLLRTDVGDHVWRYELRRMGQAEQQTEHPHFMCTDCGEGGMPARDERADQAGRSGPPLGTRPTGRGSTQGAVRQVCLNRTPTGELPLWESSCMIAAPTG